MYTTRTAVNKSVYTFLVALVFLTSPILEHSARGEKCARITRALVASQVRNTKDLARYNLLHVKRVVALAHALLAHSPELFPGLTHNLIDQMYNHDQSKFLKENLNEQIKYFGHSRESLGTDAQDFFKKLTLEDTEATFRFLKKMGHLDAQGNPDRIAQAYLKIERIADFVDRGMMGEVEFGRKMIPASKFLSEGEEQQLALFLEKRYSKIITGLEYTH